MTLLAVRRRGGKTKIGGVKTVSHTEAKATHVPRNRLENLSVS
jgi:hypothetical protein